MMKKEPYSCSMNRSGGKALIRMFAVTKEDKIVIPSSIEEAYTKQYKWMWIDFNQPSKEEEKLLLHPLNFHPLAIEDCVYHTVQRPKLDYYDDHFFLITRRLTEETYEKEEINFFIHDTLIVTFHKMKTKEVDTVFERCINSKSIETYNPYVVLYHVMDQIVDYYFPIVYALEDAVDEIEDSSLKKPMDTLLSQLFELRHELLKVRNSINPMKELLYRMLSTDRLPGVEEKSKYFSDIYDHLITLLEIIDTNREITNDLRESYISYNAHQTNRIMQMLTLITTIFMPLTFIAGIYGMNFEHMPELTFKYSYFITLGMMFLIGISMYILFKKKGWFK